MPFDSRMPAALLVCLGAASCGLASAESGSAGATRYIELQPSFVTNFGEPSDGHLMYLRADVTVAVTSSQAASAARYHLPALRHALVLLLSRQSEADVATSAGREQIRSEALASLRSILETEEGDPLIEDLLFTNFVVQQ